MRNIVISKPEIHNIRRKTAIENKLLNIGMKRHSFLAGTSLQIVQIKKITEAKFNKPLFHSKIQNF